MIEAMSRGNVAIETFPDRAALAEAAASAIADALSQGLAARGRASLVVTGGTTPGGIYDRLSRTPLDWTRVEMTLSDERWADPFSPSSNEYLVRARLLQHEAAAARFIPLMSRELTPDASAVAAERKLAAMHWPMDAVLLGMGADGHFASLFPHNPVLSESLDCNRAALCIAVPAGEPAPPQLRLSLTLKALLDSRDVLIVATGNDKRRVFEHARETDRAHTAPVAALLHQNKVPVRFLWAP